jgi:hydroxyacylglutathione hydrolase
MKLSDSLYLYPEFGMLDSNTIVIKDHINILIDVGSRSLFQNVVREMKKDGIHPEDIHVICNTHLHLDHYAACADFKKISGARILAHPLQKKYYNESVIQTARAFNMQPVEFKEDAIIDDKEFAKGELQLEIIAAPGHSLDSICFYSKPAKFMVCGDVIFARNIGRVDLPGGNAEQLKISINTLSKLDVEMLCPGHMDFVAGAEGVKDNFSFIKESVLAWL